MARFNLFPFKYIKLNFKTKLEGVVALWGPLSFKTRKYMKFFVRRRSWPGCDLLSLKLGSTLHIYKLDGVGPVEATPIGKIQLFRKIAVMRFGCPLRFRIIKKNATLSIL